MAFDINEHDGHDIYIAQESEIDAATVRSVGAPLPRETMQWVRYCRDCEEVID